MKIVINNFIFLCSASLILNSCAVFKTAKKPRTLNPVSYGQDSIRKEASTSVYNTQGLCHDLPRVAVKTAPGFCLGLVDTGEGLTKPRYAYPLDATHLLLSDMGSWNANKGKFYLLTLANKKWSRKLLFDTSTISNEKKCVLDRPHQIVQGPDQQIYLTSASCVSTIQWPLKNSVDESIEIKINNLPAEGLHPIKAIAFDHSGNIFMNIGSITDNCELETSDRCMEIESDQARAVIRQYNRLSDGNYDFQFEIFARGQRNSLALHWDDSTNSLWTGENARDYIERKDSALNGQEKPSDEMNIIKKGDQLDWPYCFEDGKVSPEFPNAICANYKHPHLLFPAHSAPLSFLKYTGNLFPKWYQNRLFVSFHGYTVYGHRIVTYKRNDLAEPVGDPLSVVYGWDAQGGQSVGSPVGLTQGFDGSVFIVEDASQKVLQLYYDAKNGDGTPISELKVGTAAVDDSKMALDFHKAEEKRRLVLEEKLKNPKVAVFAKIQSQLIDQNCTACHGNLSYPGIQILKYDDIGNYKKLKDHLWLRLSGDGVPQMPPGGLISTNKKELMELVQQWIKAGSPAP